MQIRKVIIQIENQNVKVNQRSNVPFPQEEEILPGNDALGKLLNRFSPRSLDRFSDTF